ncbi:hypothetical protein [uncultured Alteromonas sp.]|uniref:hypothetical protein n=1 Tax=uncultured Alteromonas sp. TaxID=179113 RepID=UPI0030D5090C
MKYIITTILLSGIMTSCFAIAEDIIYVDKRIMSETKQFEVHFCYRPSADFFGKPGHAYVAFAEFEQGSNKTKFHAFGATSADIIDIFGGEGYLKPEFQSHIRQNCLVVQVNSDLYSKAWDRAKPLFSEPEYAYWNYHLTDNSCVDYARAIANAIGLQSNDANVPINFIKTLQQQNN